MRFKQVGNKEDLVGVVIRNTDTVQINVGQPVVLAMNGAGVDVTLPTTAGSVELIWGLRYGVSLRNIAVNAYGEAQVFGFTNSLAVIITTRANNSASWSSTAALSLGQYLTIDTVNNYFATMASSIAYIASSTQTSPSGLTMFDAFGVLGQSVVTAQAGARAYSLSAGLASSSVDGTNLTAITASVQAFVRMM